MGQTLNKLRGRPYTAALVALGVAVVAAPSARLGYFGGVVYYAGLALAVYGATKPGWIRRGTLVYASLATVAHVANFAAGNVISGPVLFLLDFVFAAFAPVLVVRHVLSGETASTDDYAGALVSYLLIGVLFAFAHTLVEGFHPGSYGGPGTEDAVDHVGRFTYFSFVTLTTLGYGDIVPNTAPARGISVLEAVMGQGYIAILIAHLVGRPHAKARSDRA
ncbi:MAG: two pore domain potassium channel family protein [Deltaproteobacteria bacterium]|nr:two pore domain potassium channel family protein [Deltaproteobacteria bacterium]